MPSSSGRARAADKLVESRIYTRRYTSNYDRSSRAQTLASDRIPTFQSGESPGEAGSSGAPARVSEKARASGGSNRIRKSLGGLKKSLEIVDVAVLDGSNRLYVMIVKRYEDEDTEDVGEGGGGGGDLVGGKKKGSGKKRREGIRRR